jgi:tryptophanyl-tRNA synthetase
MTVYRPADKLMEIALDYLAVGIDPARSTICLRSHLPAPAELHGISLANPDGPHPAPRTTF